MTPVNSHILCEGFYLKCADEPGDSEQNVSTQEVQSDAHGHAFLASVDSFQRRGGVVSSKEVDEVYESATSAWRKEFYTHLFPTQEGALCVCFGARWAGAKKQTHMQLLFWSKWSSLFLVVLCYNYHNVLTEASSTGWVQSIVCKHKTSDVIKCPKVHFWDVFFVSFIFILL